MRIALLFLFVAQAVAISCPGLPGPFLVCYPESNSTSTSTQIDRNDVRSIHRNITYRAFVPGPRYEDRFFIMPPRSDPATECYEYD